MVGSALSALVHDVDGVMHNGITATLLTRLQILGWHVLSASSLVDDFGSFSLFDICIEELRWRMEWSWLKVVSAGVSHRPGFSELDRVDPGKTRRWLASLPPADRAVYRKLLNGAHITQDGKHYCQESDSDICEFCLSVDSRYHRFWICPAFQDCRTAVSDELFAALPELPECVTGYGWALRPSTSREWYSFLHQVRCGEVPKPPPFSGETLHVFTDGSCCNPAYPDARFASYAIVTADPAMVWPSKVLESGALPGLRQTSVRAELFAVHKVIRLAAIHSLQAMIWTDCLSVVRRLRRILGGARVKINSPNSDLWMQIQNDLDHAQCVVHCTKVAAHRRLEEAQTPLEEWCFLHNQFADHAAAKAQDHRPAYFWDLLARHTAACVKIDSWNAQIQSVLLSVSKQVLDAKVTHDGDMELVPMPDDRVPVWQPLPVLDELPSGAVRWYGLGMVQKIVSWFWPVAKDSPSPCLWVSYAQLFVDFALSTGEVGPLNIGGWKDCSALPLQGLRNVGFKCRVRSFAKVFREILRHSGVKIASAYVRPHCEMIAMHCSCLALPWPGDRLHAVDRWFLSFSCRPFRRQSKELDHLPVPRFDRRFPGTT